MAARAGSSVALIQWPILGEAVVLVSLDRTATCVSLPAPGVIYKR